MTTTSRTQTTFTLRDAAGVERKYTIIAHPAREALQLAPDVMLVFGRAIGAAIDAIGGGKSDGDGSTLDSLVGGLDGDDDYGAGIEAGDDFGADPESGADFGGDPEAEIKDVNEHATDDFGDVDEPRYDDGDSFLDDKIDGRALGDAIHFLAESFKSVGSYKIVMRLLRYTRRDGVSLNRAPAFDAAYTGNMGELAGAVVWALKVNYADVAASVAPFVKRRRRR